MVPWKKKIYRREEKELCTVPFLWAWKNYMEGDANGSQNLENKEQLLKYLIFFYIFIY